MSQGQPARSTATASMAAHMFEDATQYRERAEEARQLAEKSINPLDKEVWLRVAGEWLKLAQNAETQANDQGRLSWWQFAPCRDILDTLDKS